jgi:hypothetical protein
MRKEAGCQRYHSIGLWKQLLFANDRNMVRGAVLGLSQDGTWTDLFENLSVNRLKRYLSNATTFKPPLFSLVNTFNDGRREEGVGEEPNHT